MNNKKILALVLAFAMIFSSISTVFADTTATIGADAEALKTIGVLKGDTTEGVTPAYLAKSTTRMQAAIMFLRLKGLEDEAMAFTGTANFADANTMTWADGKAIMAYLKANPQLGWIGADAGKFNPFETVTAQQYYKVMLEALGYKQTTADVTGDFEWNDVLTFAASKGLAKVADVAKLTNNDLAIATIEGLKANVKGTETTLATSMVDAGMINKAAAIAAGLYEENSTTAVVESVKALGNSKVLVEFDSAVAKAFAENAANYKVVEKGTTTALEVKAAVLDGTKQVVLETAAQTAGKAYTMTVGEVSFNFAGVAKDTTVPEIDTVTGSDTEKVVVEFTTIMDHATALNKANYSIAGVTVENVAWDDDTDRNAVELTTKGLVANKTYKVTVTNVNSIDGVTMKSDTMNFVSKSDKKAPVLSTATAKTNTRIVLDFTDDNELTKESAENVANYNITYGANNANELEILSAKLVENDKDDMLRVELTTASQKASQKYTVKVNNLVDTSVLANKMTKASEKTVYGVKVDTTAPSVTGIDYSADTVIIVHFSDKSRLDFATAQDINNYEISNDVTVEKAEMVDADDLDGYDVRLTVSELTDKVSYKVTVNNVADEYGNVIEKTIKSKTYKSEYNLAATIKRVVATSANEVVLVFTKALNEKSAEDVTNYTINNSIGAPRKAVYDATNDDYNNAPTVTLTTGDMKLNTSYKVTINGVKDDAARVLTNIVGNFVVSSDSNDYERPEIDDVEAVNNKVIRVTFSEPMNKAGSITLSNGWTADYAVATDDDDMVLEYTIAGSNKFTDSMEDVKITAITTTDVAGNAVVLDDEGFEFGINSDEPDAVELESYDQVSVKEFRLQYSEKINIVDADKKVTDSKTGVVFTLENDEDDDSIIIAKASRKMGEDDVFSLDLSAALENFHGQAVVDPDANGKTDLEAYMVDEDAPYIESVTAVNINRIEVKFNEELSPSALGSYSLSYDDVNGDTKTITVSVRQDSKDGSLLILTPSKNLESRYVYNLIQGTSKAKDLSSNAIDAEKDEELYSFVGTNVVGINDYITGVKIYNGTKIKVYTKDDHASVTGAVYDSKGNEIALVSSTATSTDNYYYFNIKTDNGAPVHAFMDGETYTVKINDGSNPEMSYQFKGIVEDEINVTKGTNADEYIVSYDDSKANDKVAFIDAAGNAVVGDITTDGGNVTMTSTEDIVSIVVVRNGVVIFFKNAFTLADAE